MKKPAIPFYSASKILGSLQISGYNLEGFRKTSNQLLNKSAILRNACTIAISNKTLLLCSFKSDIGETVDLHIYEQSKKPYAMFECKRVGIEEGMTKGPQTIEKAKQGAYVARSASSLQKIRTEDGTLQGIIYKSDGTYIIKPFVELMEDVIFSNDKELLRRFILTVGVVSNHGNWFTAENHNKEMKVLAQSYDWLLFLTDTGLAEFIENLLLTPVAEFRHIREIFLASYKEGKKKNAFTKVKMDIEADRTLLKYFESHLSFIESWFNVISPKGKQLIDLKAELDALKNKNWTEILE